jgi:hypothetical protein
MEYKMIIMTWPYKLNLNCTFLFFIIITILSIYKSVAGF